MNKYKVLTVLAIITVVTMFLIAIIPVRSEIAYTARLTKVEYAERLLGEVDHYYFSNGRIENDLAIKDVVIGGRYKVKHFFSLIGLRLFTKAYLIG